jgi:hypothetical protein
MRPPHEIGSLKPFTWEYMDTGERESYEVSFDGANVTVDVVLNYEPREEIISQYRNTALELATTALNIVCFAEGMGLTLYLDRCVWPDGKEEIPLPGDDRLKSLVSITNIDISVMSGMLAVDQQLSRPLNDLILAITWPNAAAINCARAIEGLRRHMNPNEGDERGKSWERFQEQLNITQAFRTSVTKLSIQPRHGNASFIRSEDTEDAIIKSWKIMNRYFHYLALGKKQLDASIFELL